MWSMLECNVEYVRVQSNVEYVEWRERCRMRPAGSRSGRGVLAKSWPSPGQAPECGSPHTARYAAGLMVLSSFDSGRSTVHSRRNTRQPKRWIPTRRARRGGPGFNAFIGSVLGSVHVVSPPFTATTYNGYCIDHRSAATASQSVSREPRFGTSAPVIMRQRARSTVAWSRHEKPKMCSTE